jgi:hypothetical protein
MYPKPSPSRIAILHLRTQLATRDPVGWVQMRYSDSPSVEVELVIEAPMKQIWDLITDINLPAGYSTEFVGADWIDDGPALGARFAGRNRHDALGEWETISWVNLYEPMHSFGWAVSDPSNPSATWWFHLEHRSDAVAVRQGGRMGPAPSGLTIAITAMPEKEERIVLRRLEEWKRNMTYTLQGIKQRLQ